MTNRSRKKAHKHRLGAEWATGQLRVALGREEEGMLIEGKFQHLHNGTVRVSAGENQPV